MISVFELFKIGVGPSSSHTVGPMKAAGAFVGGLVETAAIDRVASVDVALLGSLAFTGRGHATDKAVILGLSGETPDTVDLDAAEALVMAVRETKALNLAGRRAIAFDAERAICFDTVTPAPRHPNTMRFVARDEQGRALADETWLSVGGGFIIRDGVEKDASTPRAAASVSLSLRGRASGARARSQAFDRRTHARQRGGASAPRRGRHPRRAHPRRDVRLRRPGPRAFRPAAGRPQGHAPRQGDPRSSDRGVEAQLSPGARDHGFRQRLRHGGQRGERGRRARRHRADQWRGRGHSGGAALLPRPLRRRDPGGPVGLPHDRDRDRRAVQAQCVDFGRGGRLPGRGRGRVVDGRRRAYAPRSAARTSRSRTPPRSRWSITSA